MAEQTLTLNMTQAAYVDSRVPDATGALAVGDSVVVHRYGTEYGRLFVRFAAFPSSLKRKKLLQVSQIGLLAKDRSNSSSIYDWFVYGLSDTFSKNTLTWNNRPSRLDPPLLFRRYYYTSTEDLVYDAIGWSGHWTVTTRDKSEHAKNVAKKSAIYLEPNNDSERTIYIEADHPGSGLTPYIKITYDDEEDITSQITPLNNTSGYLNPNEEHTFKWSFDSSDANYVCAGDFEQASASFYWKEHSASAYTRVAASGSTKSVTIPANTFPAGSQIDWYITGTDEDGTTTTSSVYTISTEDTTAVATAISPLNTVEDGGAEITFRWSLSNAYGNDPSLVNLWWKLPSEDNQSWHVLISSTDPITEYTAPANTFPAGEIQWLVHAYNQDNVRGPDSQGSFICVAAPAAPNGISADGVPYTTIRWQCEGQQAYHIVIDGKDYGTQFGTAKSITMEEPLGEGEHTVTITAQGVYGLWSQPGTMTFTVTNTPGDSVTLIGTEGADAVLTWETTSIVSDFYIYRDDIRIGHTSGKSFEDRLAVGTHSYYVLNKQADGNYTRSNTVTLTLSTDDTLIAEFPPIEWLSIRLTENSEPQHQYSYQKTQTTRHFYGAEYPVLEDSSFSDMSGSFDTAFIDSRQAERFEQLKGKAVVMKSKNGVFVGAMNTMQKTERQFFTAYTFALTRIHWEDYIDETNA